MSKIKKRLISCDEQLNAVFNELNVNNILQEHINEIKKYYHKVINQDEDLIIFYELLIKTLHEVKQGKLTLEEGLNRINKTASQRIVQTNTDNIFHILAMSLLLMASTFLFLVLGTLTIPFFTIHPLLGLGAIILGTELLIQGMQTIVEQLFYFQSVLPIVAEKEREQSALSFFKPTPKPDSAALSVPEEERNTPFSPC